LRIRQHGSSSKRTSKTLQDAMGSSPNSPRGLTAMELGTREAERRTPFISAYGSSEKIEHPTAAISFLN
jgi:hypothetical protein